MGAPKFSQYLELVWSVVLMIVDAMCLAFSNLIPTSIETKKDIRNEIVLITGGNSGYGQQMAIKFSQLGCRVVIWARSESKCIETVAKVEKEVYGAHKVLYYVVDVSDRAQVYATAEKVKKDIGDVTILVNNAGIAQSSYFLETSDSEMENYMKINAMAHFWTLKAFLPNMLKNNHGHLVTVASAASLVPIQRSSGYTSSKHAALGFLDSITMELIESGNSNVKTTAVFSYFSKTNLFECEYDGIIPFYSPEAVADAIIEGVLTNKQMVYVPRLIFFFGLTARLVTKASLLRIGRSITGDAVLKTIKARKSVMN